MKKYRMSHKKIKFSSFLYYLTTHNSPINIWLLSCPLAMSCGNTDIWDFFYDFGDFYIIDISVTERLSLTLSPIKKKQWKKLQMEYPFTNMEKLAQREWKK